MKKLLIALLSVLAPISADAQTDAAFVPTVKVSKVLYEGDSLLYMEMDNV